MQYTITKIRNSLSKLYTESEISIFIKLIMEHVVCLPISIMLTDKNTKITEAQELNINKIIDRLQRFEPIQYILDKTEFFGLPFSVNKDVLIPRPETEELVEKVIKDNNNSQLNILDIGTGSGCIAISLKRYLTKANITGWDISHKALKTAIKNAKLNALDVSFDKVDILDQYLTGQFFDIIVSNPPYIMDSEKKEMSNNVLDYEPHSALFVPDENPLLFYERIADISKKLLSPGGKLYFEINRSQGQQTVNMMRVKGFAELELIKDISGNDRIVKGIYIKHP